MNAFGVAQEESFEDLTRVQNALQWSHDNCRQIFHMMMQLVLLPTHQHYPKMLSQHMSHLRMALGAMRHLRTPTLTTTRYSSNSNIDNASAKSDNKKTTPETESKAKDAKPPAKKPVLQQDEELRRKLNAANSDAGVEYEDGQPASMKRSVKNNMFRYI